MVGREGMRRVSRLVLVGLAVAGAVWIVAMYAGVASGAVAQHHPRTRTVLSVSFGRSVVAGGSVVVVRGWGTTPRGVPRGRLEVWLAEQSHGRWVVLASRMLDRWGRFVIRFRAPASSGTLTLRVSLWRGHHLLARNAPHRLRVVARASSPGGHPGGTPPGSLPGSPSPAPVDPTETSLACTPLEVAVGGRSTCSISVTDLAANASSPAGAGDLLLAGVQVGSCGLVPSSASSASCEIDFVASQAGVSVLTASYPGDGRHAASQSAAQTMIAQAPIPVGVGGGGPFGGTGQSVSGTISPTSTTTISAPGGYSLTVPAGTVAQPTAATITTSDTSPDGISAPSALFHIAANWEDGSKTVLVTLPLDPDLAILGNAYQPLLIHYLDAGGVDVVSGSALQVNETAGTVSFKTTSLSWFSSFSSDLLQGLNAISDVGSFGNHILERFLGTSAPAPSCSPDSRSDPALQTSGNFGDDVPAAGNKPPVEWCVSKNGSSATWTLVNNTGAVFALDIEGTSNLDGQWVTTSNMLPSGEILTDYAFSQINSSGSGSGGRVPRLLELPPGAGVQVTVPEGASSSITITQDPLATLRAFVMDEISGVLSVGQVASVAPDLWDAFNKCRIFVAANATDVFKLVSCVVSSGSLALAAGALGRDAPKLLKAAAKLLGIALLLAPAAYTLDDSLAIGTLHASLSYPDSSSSGSGGSGSQTGSAVIAAGYGHTCALLGTGHVACWGKNSGGQLGDGTSTGPDTCNGTPCSETPVQVSGVTDATAITAGGQYSCALLASGHVDCWGYPNLGELGDGATSGPDTCGTVTCNTSPVSVTGITDAIAVSAGAAHTCALLATGHIDCWGDNIFGELGDGSNTGPDTCNGTPCSETPVQVTGITDAIAVSAGHSNTCALLSSGQVDCWGDNSSGELGDGSSSSGCNCSTTPVAVSGITHATAISAGSGHSCALLSSGQVDCWGDNGFGELGDGTFTGPETCTTGACSTTPVAVDGISGSIAITAGGADTCALLSSGQVDCWGDNGFGELGDGISSGPDGCGGDPCGPTPGSVVGITDATAITAGEFHTCTLLSSGQVDCWGDNSFGELGDGTVDSSSGPVAVSGLSDVG